MENKKTVKIGITTGRLNKRITMQNKLFRFSNGKEEELRPIETSVEKWNNERIYYNLPEGENCCIRSIMVKNGGRLNGMAILKVESGKVSIVRWKGNFCPKFIIC